MTPAITSARVLAVDIPSRRLVVELPSRQVVKVRMLHHGPADGLRVSHSAMPGRFTYGLVIFPGGDNRSGFWVGSFYGAQEDALATDTDQFLEYNSHWSGAYEVLDGEGRWTKAFPDGTFIQVSDSTTKPTLYRHTVDQSQNQQLTEFTDAERVKSKPSPRNVVIDHPSGTTHVIDTNGNVLVTGGQNSKCTLSFGGGTVTIDNKGNITATAASGAEVYLTANGGFLQIDQNGAINGNAASGQHMNFSAGDGATSFTLVRSDLLTNWLLNHTHLNGNNGGNTGVPVQAINPGLIQSTMANVSE